MVITIIALILGIILPSIVGLFSAGADAQAYNALLGQLAAARAYAMQNGVRAGVLVKMADASSLTNTCWSAVVAQDPNGLFYLAKGFAPRRFPGTIAFGQVSNVFVNNAGNFISILDDPIQANYLGDFTTFTILFSPTGRLETMWIDDKWDANDPMYDPSLPNFLWGRPHSGGYTVNAVALFDYARLKPLNPNSRANYLQINAQFLPVNAYTGELLSRH